MVESDGGDPHYRTITDHDTPSDVAGNVEEAGELRALVAGRTRMSRRDRPDARRIRPRSCRARIGVAVPVSELVAVPGCFRNPTVKEETAVPAG